MFILSTVTPFAFGYNISLINLKEKQSSDWPHQEGWPVKFDINSSHYSMIYDPVVCDLEGDGNLDVIVTYSLLVDVSYIDAYNLDGSRKTDLGFPLLLTGGRMSGASIGDLDNDGDVEIVVSIPRYIDGICYTSLYVFEYNGAKFVESWNFLESIPSASSLHTPALGDIDGDGDLEIIIGNARNDSGWTGVVYAFHDNGSMISGWPVTNNHALGGFYSPALGDIDNDGRMEIIAGSVDHYVYAWNGDGSLVMGNWPVNIGDCIIGQPPQIGDLDDDGNLEIVQIGNNNGSIFIFDAQGNIIWTLIPPPGEEGIGKTPALGDIDGDGDLEVFTEIHSKIYGWHHNGTLIDGWPVDAGCLQVVRLSTTIGDIDNDIHPDILLISNSGIFSFHANGTLIDGWPYIINDSNNMYSSPLLTDLDKDGDVEVVFTYAYLYWPGVNGSSFTIDVLDIPGLYNASTMHWPMCQHDSQHTGLYSFGPKDLKAYAHGPFFGLVDNSVKFSSAGTGGNPPYSWYWDFGDGDSSYEQNPTHIYTEPGNYTVIFTVSDDISNSSSITTWAKIKETNNPPRKPSISGPTYGKKGQLYDYDFNVIEPDADEYVYYYIDWGDDTNTGWIGPYRSDEIMSWSHKWTGRGVYTINCKAKDSYGAEGPWGELIVTMPRDKTISSSPLMRFLERYPLLQTLLLRLGFQ